MEINLSYIIVILLEKFLCKWLKANKISLNASKTELIIFRDPRRKSEHDLKIKIDGKKLQNL